jgi:hypothetical protein
MLIINQILILSTAKLLIIFKKMKCVKHILHVVGKFYLKILVK